MTAQRLMVVAAALLLSCVLAVAGCGSADTAVTSDTARLYPVMVGDKWGFIDNTGTIKIEPQFDNVEVPWLYGPPDIFFEGLAAVAFGKNDEEKWGYADTTGAMVISPRQCKGAGPFSGGVAALTGAGNVNGSQAPIYIDKTGKVIWQRK